mmetsp:Transcript_13321/g.23592  ORF Transcript_13321/g.23592 Transcript_13321/m.23592 type:complete len:91 (-) Transcript_13321:635-907(-)
MEGRRPISESWGFGMVGGPLEGVAGTEEARTDGVGVTLRRGGGEEERGGNVTAPDGSGEEEKAGRGDAEGLGDKLVGREGTLDTISAWEG